MPQIDLPLEELQTYQGINPRPADFEPFWRTSLEELNHIDPSPEILENNFTVPFAHCYDLFFTGTLDARIHAKYVKPVHLQPPYPVVLQFHGYTANSGDWVDKLALVASGFAVMALDCRGQGGLSEITPGFLGTTLRGHIIKGLEDSPQQLSYRHIFLDTVQLARVAASLEEIDADRMAAMGGSQGGGLTLVCGALEPRIKKLVSRYPFLSDYKRVWDLDIGGNAYEEMIQYFRRFDPEHAREEEIFTTLGYIDVQHFCPWIEGEVLMCTNLMDEICPPSTQFAAYNKITSPKTMKVHPDFAHETPPGFEDAAYQFLCGLL